MGNTQRELIDLTGQRFDRLVVTREAPPYITPSGKEERQWYCDCECGTKDVIRKQKYLTRSNKYPPKIKSCGCYAKEVHYRTHKKFNKYDLSGEYGIGYTDKGEEFYFDLEDYDKIKDLSWYMSHGYICSQFDRQHRIRMHRYLLGVDKDIETVDHINGCKYDNRKANLRIATFQQNNRNVGKYKNNSSGQKGVYWDKERNKWYSDITVNKKTVHLGRFNTFEEAKEAWEKAEAQYQKEFSYTYSQAYSEENSIDIKGEIEE